MIAIDQQSGQTVCDHGFFLVAYRDREGRVVGTWTTNLKKWLEETHFQQYAAGIVCPSGSVTTVVFRGMGSGPAACGTADAFLESYYQTLEEEPNGPVATRFRHPAGTFARQEVSA